MKSNACCLFCLKWLCVVLCVVTLQLVVPTAAAAGEAADQVQALALLNIDRAKNGRAPLVYSGALTKLAEDYAQDMMDRQFFSHDNPEGLSPFDRMKAYGIAYLYAGENLAINDSVAAAQVAFMNSPTHRANVLNPDFKEVGIGVRRAPNGKVYVVQTFIGK